MSRKPVILLLIGLSLWLSACLALRYGFMQDARWVGACADDPAHWACRFRSAVGLTIHFRLLAWVALAAALLGFIMPGAGGRRLALFGMLFALPALVLYTASLAGFAVVLAALRLVRAPRQITAR
jgi:hypothetical protein